MNLFSDHDVFGATVRFLRAAGHDVLTAADLGLSHADDTDLLLAARAQQRILVTRDRDFGTLVFLTELGSGVIYLRMLPQNQDSVHAELTRVLILYSETELLNSFVVVEPARHRIRRLS